MKLLPIASQVVSPFEGMGLDILGIDEETELGLTRFASRMVDFGATGVEEIFQNIKFILITEYFSVVLDREFGTKWTMVDKPIPIAMLMLDQEVAMKIALYEPRASFEEIEYSGDGLTGKLEPNVKCRILVTEGQQRAAPALEEPSYVVQGLTAEQIGRLPSELQAVARPAPPAGILIPVAGRMGSPGPPGPAGPAGPEGTGGPQGRRGSFWFTGHGVPSITAPTAQAEDLYLDTNTGNVWKFDLGRWVRQT